tara:strand:+ start:401 stop:772 length:372 start_codon:yes stop_codon:yes gene_type:complete
MKVCIFGSRTIDKPEIVFPIIDKFLENENIKIDTFLIGNAKGLDPLIKKFAETRGIDTVEFVPYHLLDPTEKFNSKYFFVRTKQMINNADKVLAIWNMKSKGTEYGIKYSQKKGIPISIIKVP